MRLTILVAATAVLASTGCRMHLGGDTPDATAVMRNAAGDSLGVLELDWDDNELEIEGTVHGLSAGAHGIHIHAVGTCDAPAFTSAGGHLNPAGMHHGLSNPQGPHAGDFPNVSADASGTANVDVSTTHASMSDVRDADGSAIVVHSGADDQVSDPSGNSGSRVACGVVH